MEIRKIRLMSANGGNSIRYFIETDKISFEIYNIFGDKTSPVTSMLNKGIYGYDDVFKEVEEISVKEGLKLIDQQYGLKNIYLPNFKEDLF